MDEAEVRRVAREEIASLCGLIMRRLQDVDKGEPMRLVHTSEVAAIFGEALRDFSSTGSEPGEDTPAKSVTISAPTAEAGITPGQS